MFVSAEIRWFYPDECPANLHRWFGGMSPAPGGGKLRIDEYLSQTNQSEVSIKRQREEPVDKVKPFDIPKREVWEAFKRVKANQGAAGVDGQSIAEFEANLSGNLYKLWNRLSSG
jgi:retron-type reverse transcriptase